MFQFESAIVNFHWSVQMYSDVRSFECRILEIEF